MNSQLSTEGTLLINRAAGLLAAAAEAASGERDPTVALHCMCATRLLRRAGAQPDPCAIAPGIEAVAGAIRESLTHLAALPLHRLDNDAILDAIDEARSAYQATG
jgi:hypothetical protein